MRCGSEQVDCLVVQSGFSELQPNDLIEIVEERSLTRQLPVVLYGTGRLAAALARLEAPGRRVRAARGALAGAAARHRVLPSAPQRHGAVAGAARGGRRSLHNSSRVLEGKKALVVDDDMRNIFALSPCCTTRA